MGERRALIEGLDAITDADPELAADFVYDRESRSATKSPASGLKAPKQAEADTPAHTIAPPAASSPLTGVGRVPVGARVRTELAAALKRASLERQLKGIRPNTVQEILEDSLQLWLLQHGHST